MNTTIATPIQIQGARTHNLKNLSIAIPRDQVVVITGPSGSGKSSLAIDTLSAEGQRQFFESLSIHSRQFFKQLPAADVDSIEGLPPTVFIDQGTGFRSRRSTVGTLTEIYDYLRVLLARCGVLHCRQCGQPIEQTTLEQIQRWVERLPERTKLVVLAPLVDNKAGDHSEVLDRIRRERLVRVRINGLLSDIDQVGPLDPALKYSFAAVTDRLVVRPEMDSRLLDAIALAERLALGRVIVSYEQPDSNLEGSSSWLDRAFSTRYACASCDLTYEEIQPNTFSFNSPHGACTACQGLGETIEAGQDLPSQDLDAAEIPESSTANLCRACQGSRLNEHARSVFLQGFHVGQLLNFSISTLDEFFGELSFGPALTAVAQPLVAEIQNRLTFLRRAGVDYLSLGRSASSLSGGEYQRVRLATSIGSGLTNVGYILDEPSVGLHPRDSQRLIDSIRELQRAGNSVILVEHDEATIRQADYIIDMGPGAGQFGGMITATGTPEEISANPQSLTGKFLSGDRRHRDSKLRRVPSGNSVRLLKAHGRNLKHVDLELPLGLFVVISGVSGSGKSSLINQTLVPALIHSIRQRQGQRSLAPLSCLPFEALLGAEQIDRVSLVDQWPIGRSARGCPATVLGILDPLRMIFAATKRAKQLGFGAARFSFNSKTGWCPECRGLGGRKIEMNLIPDFYVSCESCQGRRFNMQTLQVRFKDQSIADVLGFSVAQAREFFDGFETVAGPLKMLDQVGLGYLQLGQPTRSLSGGESQRLKLAAELANRNLGHTLYVLDEPTTGLHFSDIEVLLKVFNDLVHAGNSLIVIEHHLDVIRSADWVIDLGPEGGDRGGEILATGSPNQLRGNRQSYTAQFL